MSAEALRDGRENMLYYEDLLAQLIVEVTAGVYQLVTTTGITDRVMETLREGRPNNPYFEDLISKCMLYDSGTGKYYLNVSGGGGGGGNLQTTLDAGNSADNKDIQLTKNSVDNKILLDVNNAEIALQKSTKQVGKLTSNVSGSTLRGELQVIDNNTSSGAVKVHKITGTGTVIAGTNTHFLQRRDGTFIQTDNENGVGILLNGGGVLTLDTGNVNILNSGSFTANDNSTSRKSVLNSVGFTLNETNGAGSITNEIIKVYNDGSQNIIYLFDTISGSSIELKPFTYNNQTVTFPDVTGGLKCVGTYNETFSSGVLSITDTRFIYDQPNFLIVITDVNGSTAIGVNYEFNVNTFTETVTITSLKANGGTETLDNSIVRISCFY